MRINRYFHLSKRDGVETIVSAIDSANAILKCGKGMSLTLEELDEEAIRAYL